MLVASNRPEVRASLKPMQRASRPQTIDHRRFPDREAFEAELDRALERAGIGIVCLAFLRVLTPGFVERWRDRLLNIHPSLLPAFPGLDTHARALRAGVRAHGCTVHLVRVEVDRGRSSCRVSCRCWMATTRRAWPPASSSSSTAAFSVGAGAAGLWRTDAPERAGPGPGPAAALHPCSGPASHGTHRRWALVPGSPRGGRRDLDRRALRQGIHRCNIWHLRGRERDLLVDSGWGVVSMRRHIPLVTERPLVAVASHTHFDHIAGHHEFAERWVHRAEAAFLVAPTRDNTLVDPYVTDAVFHALPPLPTARPPTAPRPRPAHLLEDGDVSRSRRPGIGG